MQHYIHYPELLYIHQRNLLFKASCRHYTRNYVKKGMAMWCTVLRCIRTLYPHERTWWMVWSYDIPLSLRRELHMKLSTQYYVISIKCPFPVGTFFCWRYFECFRLKISSSSEITFLGKRKRIILNTLEIITDLGWEIENLTVDLQ